MARETGTCEWCRESMRLDPSRIIRDYNGFVLLRDPQGRLHSFSSKKETEMREALQDSDESFTTMLSGIGLEASE
jgi:hypothetical protein